MNDPVVETLVDKVEAAEARLGSQEKSIGEMSGTINNMKDQTVNMIRIAGLVDQLQKQMSAVRFPVNQMADLEKSLHQHYRVMIDPPPQKMVHTAHKLIWIVAGLFVAVIGLTLLFIEQTNRLDQYRMHDITWRHIKLRTGKEGLPYLQRMERDYINDPKEMTRNVEEEELKIQQQEENRRLAAQKEQEALELKREAGDIPTPHKKENNQTIKTGK